MATSKQKKTVKVRDLKPSKDAKGGGSRTLGTKPLGTKPLGTKPLSHSNVVHN